MVKILVRGFPDHIPNSAMLKIAGSSIMDHGLDFSDNGVQITMRYYSKGIMLTLNFDDCGSEGSNPDNDFKDKQILL